MYTLSQLRRAYVEANTNATKAQRLAVKHQWGPDALRYQAAADQAKAVAIAAKAAYENATQPIGWSPAKGLTYAVTGSAAFVSPA